MAEVEVTEGKFGTVGAVASAFVPGFYPLCGIINKSGHNSGRKSKHSPQLRRTPGHGADAAKHQQQICRPYRQAQTGSPAQYSIMKGEVIQMIDPNVKQDLREMGKKLTNLRGSL
ncbi:hypothetical protein BK146_18145 [Paenibacillus sp. FSL R7-0333]|nr:hypothetical protein BK146_18145 [Paenibacillus sp. FSL R7-0333]